MSNLNHPGGKISGAGDLGNPFGVRTHLPMGQWELLPVLAELSVLLGWAGAAFSAWECEEI